MTEIKGKVCVNHVYISTRFILRFFKEQLNIAWQSQKMTVEKKQSNYDEAQNAVCYIPNSGIYLRTTKPCSHQLPAKISSWIH